MNTTTSTATVVLSDTRTEKAETSLDVTLQLAVEELDSLEPPSITAITKWAQAAFAACNCAADDAGKHNTKAIEVTIRLVDKPEIIELNLAYRGKSSPTNVLSFAAQLPPELVEELEVDLLGDIVICHAVVTQEAKEQQKAVADHYAHMVTHGVLHLCGYDHEDDDSAMQMEALETRILAESGINNPYC